MIKLKIVIGIPAYNEEKNIGAIILKLKKITDHIIVCNEIQLLEQHYLY